MFLTIRARNVHGGFSGKNLDHPKFTILYFWMIFIVLGHFLKISVLDQLYIAYLDSTKLFPQIHHGISHAGSSKNLKIEIFYYWMIPNFSQEPCIVHCSHLARLYKIMSNVKILDFIARNCPNHSKITKTCQKWSFLTLWIINEIDEQKSARAEKSCGCY